MDFEFPLCCCSDGTPLLELEPLDEEMMELIPRLAEAIFGQSE